MKLKLIREPSSETTTLGKLYVNGEFECYTLEDKVREVKYAGITAIPAGTYKVIVTWSPRFKRQLPLLINVPEFDGVRIHPGNTHRDTEGCILIGTKIEGDRLVESRKAFDKLFEKIVNEKDCTIEIV
jgi:hypothetical protein